MTDLQENKLSAYEAVDYVLNTDAHKAIWQADTDFAALVTQLANNITDIRSIRAIQEQDTTGIAGLKTSVRKELIAALNKVINGVVAHAIYTGDLELQNSVNYSEGYLQNSRDNLLADAATVVYGIAWSVRTSLISRRVTEADITLIETLKQQFLQLIPEPRAGIVENKAATAALKSKIRDTDLLLSDKIDRTILIYRPEYPDFVRKYFDARIIVASGVRHTNIKSSCITGTVLQAVTLIPIYNALVEVVGTKRFTKTDINGNFKLDFRKKAFVTLRVSFIGYNTYTSQLITVTPGNQINLKIELDTIK